MDLSLKEIVDIGGNAAVAVHGAAYVQYLPRLGKVVVWDGDRAGRMRVYDAEDWTLVEAWQGGGPVHDRWEARERIRGWEAGQ